MPKKVKYRKQQRGRMTGKAWRGSTLAFGDFGLKVLEPGWITDRQIEASRVAMTRFVKRGGKIWIRLFPDKPVTKKPAETRMGKDGLFVPLLLPESNPQRLSLTLVIPNPRQARVRNLLLIYFAANFFFPAAFLLLPLTAGARRRTFAPSAVSPPAAWTTASPLFPRSANINSM